MTPRPAAWHKPVTEWTAAEIAAFGQERRVKAVDLSEASLGAIDTETGMQVITGVAVAVGDDLDGDTFTESFIESFVAQVNSKRHVVHMDHDFRVVATIGYTAGATAQDGKAVVTLLLDSEDPRVQDIARKIRKQFPIGLSNAFNAVGSPKNPSEPWQGWIFTDLKLASIDVVSIPAVEASHGSLSLLKSWGGALPTPADDSSTEGPPMDPEQLKTLLAEANAPVIELVKGMQDAQQAHSEQITKGLETVSESLALVAKSLAPKDPEPQGDASTGDPVDGEAALTPKEKALVAALRRTKGRASTRELLEFIDPAEHAPIEKALQQGATAKTGGTFDTLTDADRKQLRKGELV